MARRIKHKKRDAAKKGWATRHAKQRKAQAAERARQKKNDAELNRIEKLLGEEFESLAEARRALKQETSLPPPSQITPESIEEFEHWVDQYEEAGVEFEDQGEYGSGVDTGEAS